MNNTLIKGLCLLEALARRGEPMGVSELAQSIAMPKSGVHRLLQSLVDERYVEHSGTGRYRVSTKLWEVASATLPGLDLRRHAEVEMNALAEETGESVYLSVLDHREVVYVHKLETTYQDEMAYRPIVGRVPAHCVSTGKAIVAFRRTHWILSMANDLRSATENTIIEPGRFIAEMALVRERGYATNHEEWKIGISGFAAPIIDKTGVVKGAIGISGRSSRFTGSRGASYAARILKAGHALSTNGDSLMPHSLLIRITHGWNDAPKRQHP